MKLVFNYITLQLQIKMNIASIKNAFGNHNDLQLFVEFVTTNDMSILPPWPTVLFRTVDCSVPDAETVNAQLLHKALTKKLLRELIRKYQDYQQPM